MESVSKWSYQLLGMESEHNLLLTLCVSLLLAYIGVFEAPSIAGVPIEAPTNGAAVPNTHNIDEHDDYWLLSVIWCA